jgi:hypothetical protein
MPVTKFAVTPGIITFIELDLKILGDFRKWQNVGFIA